MGDMVYIVLCCFNFVYKIVMKEYDVFVYLIDLYLLVFFCCSIVIIL